MSHTLLDSDRTSVRDRREWRARVDDAWRTPAIRSEFEAENRLRPLGSLPETRDQDDASGYTRDYHDLFMAWATLRMGLEQIAPSPVRRRMGELVEEKRVEIRRAAS